MLKEILWKKYEKLCKGENIWPEWFLDLFKSSEEVGRKVYGEGKLKECRRKRRKSENMKRKERKEGETETNGGIKKEKKAKMQNKKNQKKKVMR